MSPASTPRRAESLDDIRNYVLEVAEGLDPGSRYVKELLAVIDGCKTVAEYDARISDPALCEKYRKDGAQVSEGGRGLSWLDQETWASMDIWERTLSNLITAETRMMFRFDGRDLELLSSMLTRVARGPRLDVLCVPCSTGKEVFSYAIVALRAGLDARVVGVDRQRAYVERARTGELVYHWRDREFEDAPRWLISEGPKTALVRPEVLERCSFETGDVIAGVLPRGPFDLVACRNLLGYFRGDALRGALGHLAARVRPGGVLFLDPYVLHDDALAEAPRWLAEHGWRAIDEGASYLTPRPS